jgi:Tfp pilus assembly protein PilO
VPSPFEEFQIDLSVTGDFHELGNFLADLETRLPAIRLDSLAVAPRGETRPQGLRITYRASMLRFSEKGFPPEKRPPMEDGMMVLKGGEE